MEYKASTQPLHRRIQIAFEGLRMLVNVFGIRSLPRGLRTFVRYVITAEVPIG